MSNAALCFITSLTVFQGRIQPENPFEVEQKVRRQHQNKITFHTSHLSVHLAGAAHQ